MKKFISLGIILSISFFLSSTSFASLLESQEISRIVNFQPALDQEQIVGNLNELVTANNDGTYQYYKFGSSGKSNVRVLSKNDRTEIDILDKKGTWNLAQIHFDQTGVIANYKRGKLLSYTKRLGKNILAIYHDQDQAEADKTDKSADFYIRFSEDGIYTCYCETFEQALNRTASTRVFSDDNRYQVEFKKSDKWNLAMLIHPEKGTIANYENRHFVGMSKIDPDGQVNHADNKLARL